MKDKETQENKKGPLWSVLQKVEGDKVIMIIVLLLMLVSFLAIFSSTPLLPAQESRLKTMTEHGIVALLGIGIMFLLYHIKIEWLKPISKYGFILSAGMLALLLIKVNIPGIIQTQTINGAVRNFRIAGLQVHVFEVVKVAMIMYLAWAMNAVKENKGKDLKLANNLIKRSKRFSFLKSDLGKRIFYIYGPTLLVSLMVFIGSGSSAIFICAILIAVMLVGGVPIKELALAGLVVFIGFFSLVAIHKISDGKAIQRVGTMISRMNADYDIDKLAEIDNKIRSLTDEYSCELDKNRKEQIETEINVLKSEFNNVKDEIDQPVKAKIAVHEGGFLGKGIGNSTQKYCVPNIYGDYMYSFLIEEYGLIGGLFILILYVSLLARSSIIARMCSDDFAKFVLGGLSLLITGQAFMHILVNVDIGPMTGQTLPLISHGASAFLVFCIAFGIIISISRMAKKKIQTIEESVQEDKNALQENIEKAAKSKD